MGYTFQIIILILIFSVSATAKASQKNIIFMLELLKNNSFTLELRLNIPLEKILSILIIYT